MPGPSGAVRAALWVASCLAPLASGCTGTARPALPSGGPPAPTDLVVLHTNDNWGETKPCG